MKLSETQMRRMFNSVMGFVMAMEQLHPQVEMYLMVTTTSVTLVWNQINSVSFGGSRNLQEEVLILNGAAELNGWTPRYTLPNEIQALV